MEECIGKILSFYKKHLEIDENKEAILKYSLQITISTIFSFGLALIVAWPLGIVAYVFMMMMTNATLRFFSGGAHCESMRNCTIYGMVLCNIAGLLTENMEPDKNILYIAFGIFLFSVWAIQKYAPSDTPQKPITSKKKRKKLKIRAFIFVCAWNFCVINYYIIFHKVHPMMLASALGILSQSFSITQKGYQFAHGIDRLFNKILGE
ncbi:accessory gene regulator ArgB-like protein [Marinisporobacter balticus]|uniref:Accessory gene regulator B n=1 Tax=Marinisporobacter balticus TaxID=2018667 RepID=A0A4V2SB74_9FIRM|nr:accessory gene regulator B family protein [Marinisporobacter balticus]TCO74380.1 accessory gene regulator B [Marinisporobacter balticus]